MGRERRDARMMDSGSPPDEEADAAAGEAKARLTRLKINRFRQVVPGTELRFDDGINVLLGRNGTGKTTLLELIVAVARGNLHEYQHESFDLEFDIHVDCFSVAAMVQNSGSVASSIIDPVVPERLSSWKLQMDLSGPHEERATIEATHRSAKLTLAGQQDEELPESSISPFNSMFYMLSFWKHLPEGNRLLGCIGSRRTTGKPRLRRRAPAGGVTPLRAELVLPFRRWPCEGILVDLVHRERHAQRLDEQRLPGVCLA